MHLLLAANKLHKMFARQCVRSLDALGYQWTMFDLGGLGFGHSYPIQDKTFLSRGCYQSFFKRRPTRGLHKPQIIAEFFNTKFLRDQVEWIVYLDTDTLVRQR